MRDSPSTDEDFTTFVAARSSVLYRSAWLLTTSAPAAEDLVQSALAKAYVHWRKVQAADDPVAYVHGIVLKTFLSNRRRRSSSEIPVDATPDRPSRDRDPTERLALMPRCALCLPSTAPSWCCAIGRTARSTRPPTRSTSPPQRSRTAHCEPSHGCA